MEDDQSVVHVFYSQVTRANEAVLTAAELGRWRSLSQSDDQDRLATGQMLLRFALKTVLGTTINLSRRCPQCGSTSHGPQDIPGASISLAHSGRLVACAVLPGAGAVGVDVEAWPQESFDLGDIAPFVLAVHEPRRDLLRTWVRKEALLKASRRGLDQAMSDITLAGPEGLDVLDWRRSPFRLSQVHLVDLPPIDGYCSALAVVAEQRPRTFIRWVTASEMQFAAGHQWG